MGPYRRSPDTLGRIVRVRLGAIDHAGGVTDASSFLNLAAVAEAMERQWREAEIRPPLGLERATVRNGDLYVEHWATATPKLHAITIRRADLIAAIANDPEEWSDEEDPNYELATWLLMEIEEELDSNSPSPTALVFDPVSGSFSN
jgi:hypothetical protein